jgi:hypothetical protein
MAKQSAIFLGVILAWTLSQVAAVTAQTTKTFVVTSTASGSSTSEGTLIWAIYQANYQGGDINYVNFNIPNVTSEVEITLPETLYLARPTIVNGATQPGYAGHPLIRINCNRFASGFVTVGVVAGIPPLSDGSPSTGSGSAVQGFRIINYTSNAVTILRQANSVLVANNYIGFAPLPIAGTYFRNVTVSPLCGGIGIQSDSNVIRDNTISGAYNAIVMGEDVDNPGAITGATFKNNVFERNFIGTDPTGTTKIGNDSDGIFFGAGCQQNLIGPGNVFSGNNSAGVELLHPTVTNNRIFGNMIGLNAAGTDLIANGELGVLIANGAANNWVGGPYGGAYAGNVISGNGHGGVAIGTGAFPGPDGSNDNHVEGNIIGPDAAETRALGTQDSGVVVQTGSKRNIVRKNVIVGQVNHGVVFADAASNEVYGNWIGVTSRGARIENGSFGVYLFNSTNNIVQLPAASAGPGRERNVFGQNTNGSVGLYGNSTGNVVDLTTSARLLNISSRMRVETGDNALIAGFIVTGNSPKRVIIRGMGTSLPVPQALADPTLQLITPTGSIYNDDWRSTQEQEIIAAGIPPTSNLESAIIATLDPGSYTAVMRGDNNGTGVGLVEVYDLDSPASSVLANISTRGIVQTGDNVMVAGFILGAGQADSRVVVRALGQSLGGMGVSNPLNDPILNLVNTNGAVVQYSDNWQENSTQAVDLGTLNLAPPNALESAIVAILPPGAYTAVVADRNGSSGTALVEVYNIQ